MCGAGLEAGHRFCWRCGAPLWPLDQGSEAGARAGEVRPPPTPGTPAFSPPVPPRTAALGMLPWLYAAGAVYLLVMATQSLAYYLNPSWRQQQLAFLAGQGYGPSTRPGVLALSGILLVGVFLVAAAIHGLAFYGLRRIRRWGWLSAVVVAGFWSLLLVGIPVLVRLTNSSVRHAYGVE